MKLIATTIRLLAVLLFTGGCAVLYATPAAGQCRASSNFSTSVREQLTPIATGTDSISAYWRSIYNFNKVDSASQVAFVADTAICRAAADAMGEGFDPPRDHTSYPLGMWVLAVGPTRYVVFDGQQQAAGSFWVLVFDQDFNYIDMNTI